MKHPQLKQFFVLAAFVCVLLSYVAGVLLWIFFFDEPGPEQGFETIMAATVMSPAAFVFGFVYAIWVNRQPRLFWIILMITMALWIGVAATVMITREANQQKEERPKQMDSLVMCRNLTQTSQGNAVA